MNKRIKYFLAFGLLLAVEVLIALYVHDRFVRPYIGDVLVVMVLYFFVRIFVPDRCRWLPLGIFVFAASVEVLQYFRIVELMGLSDIAFMRILVGSVFDVKDIICYGAGCLILQIAQKRRKNVSDEMTKDMTKGAILPLIIQFTIPLVLGNLLQLTYNAVDGIIVGQYVGKEALAAVGTSNPLVTLIILFVQGICLGTGILIGTLYGAGDYEALRRQVSTAMVSGIVFSFTLTVIVLGAAPALLRLLQVNEGILGEAVIYLRIIICGMVFNFIYNFFASTLRAMGDSRSPLYFLGISAALNIIGDLVFVIFFSMGTMGCAVSTVLSEACSCLLCWIYIKRRIPVMNLGKRWLVFDKKVFGQTIRYGFVSAMQQSTVQLGKLGIQGIVNTMGVTATAAFAAINRIDDYAYIPEQNIGHAMTSVMAQNRGAGKMQRVGAAFRVGMYVEVVYGIAAGILLLFFANPIMGLFTRDEATILLGEQYLHLIAFMYIVPAVTNGVQGYFRGMGDLQITLWSSLINMGVRVAACIFLVFYYKMGIVALPWAYLLGWAAMMLYELPFLMRKR